MSDKKQIVTEFKDVKVGMKGEVVGPIGCQLCEVGRKFTVKKVTSSFINVDFEPSDCPANDGFFYDDTFYARKILVFQNEKPKKKRNPPTEKIYLVDIDNKRYLVKSVEKRKAIKIAATLHKETLEKYYFQCDFKVTELSGFACLVDFDENGVAEI